MKKIYSVLLSGLLLTPFTHVFATIAGGTATLPGGISNVAYNKPSSVSIRWSLTRAGGGGGSLAGNVVTSSSATFTNIGGGTLLGTTSKSITKTDTPDATGGTDFVTINETVIVPRSVVFKAYNSGLKQISYNRSFTDCPGTSCGAGIIRITLNLSGAGSAASGISSYKLRFEDDSISQVIGRKDDLHALVTMYPSRTGLIRGVWEIATSSSAVGEPVYKTLQLVSKQGVNGVPLRIKSKLLPSDSYGLHLARFRMIEPDLSSDDPVLQYMVVQGSGKMLSEINLLAPGKNGLVSSETAFKWRSVEQAFAYKIEFIKVDLMNDVAPDNDAAGSAVGMLLRTENNTVVLPENSWSRLESGRRYWWHVNAIDKNGSIIAQSNWQKIFVR